MLAEKKNFWNNLGKIQIALSLSDRDFSNFLDIKHNQFLNKKRNLEFLPINCVFECAEKLNFHFEDLLHDTFDITPILSKIQDTHNLPSKYAVATYSSTRPIMNVINYIERNRGERAKTNLLRKFQTTEEFLNNINQKTNILLMSDMIRYLAETYNLKHQDFYALGRMTPFTLMNQGLINELGNKSNVYQLLDYFLDEIAHRFDKNFTYRINNISGDYAILEALPNKYVVDELNLKDFQFGNEETCCSRMGVLSSITWAKYKTFAETKKISSIYQGDQTNLYLFDLTPFKKLSGLNTNRHIDHTIYH